MEFKLKLIVLMFGILCTGLTSGLCFTWSNAITTGIGKLDDFTYLKSFQAMNRTILNRSFFIVFFSPILLLFLNALLHKKADPITFWSFLIAAIVFSIGIGLITVFKNVPLNGILENSILENMSISELKILREKFEKPWNHWHMWRAIASITAFILLLIGVIHNK